MSRTITQNMRSDVLAPQTSACYLVILEINSDDLTTPIYVVNNNEDITHNSQVYSAVSFSFSLPSESESAFGSSSITIDNIDRSFTIAVRSVRKPLNVTAKIIEQSNPDVVEVGPFDFQLRQVKYTATQLQGQLFYNNYLEKNAGTVEFSNLVFPGLFI